MKRNLAGLLISLLIHGGLFLLVTHGLTAEKPIARQIEKPVPLRLAMFQEPAPTAQPITPQVKPSVKPQPQPIVTTRPQTIAKPKKEQQKLKPITKKISKKSPEKTQKKPTLKKKAPKTKKRTTRKDPALDEMIQAYQAAQRNTSSITQPRRTNIITRQKPIPKSRPAHKPKKKRVRTASIKPTNKQAEQHYKAQLQRLIAQQKTYPARAKRQHKEGTVIVSFMLYPNGAINKISIKQRSGSNILDKAALQTIRRISGRLAFPPTIQRKQWRFTLPLVYQLR